MGGSGTKKKKKGKGSFITDSSPTSANHCPKDSESLFLLESVLLSFGVSGFQAALLPLSLRNLMVLGEALRGVK